MELNIIPTIFHYIFTENNDLKEYQYFSIKSIIELHNNSIIYIHYYDEIPSGFLWNKILNKIEFIKIKIPKKLHNKYKNAIIYKILYDYGGIYLDFKTLLLNSLNNYLNNNIIYCSDNSLIGVIKNNDIIYTIFDFYQNNPDEIYDLSNTDIKVIELNYDTSNNNIKYLMLNEIYDYSFSQYFHIVNNCFLFSFKNFDNEVNILNMDFIFNKTTVYNLLIRKILTHNLLNNLIGDQYINKDQDINKDINGKISLINNIDKIYWINMEVSKHRKQLMENILNKINIENERFIAYDGSRNLNIDKKYFYAKNGIYPNKFSNKEYAILLSHLCVIEKYIITSNYHNKYNVALICEDDLSLDFIKYWNKDFKTIIEEAPYNWDIIMLGYFSLCIDRKELYQKWNNEWSAIAYLVNHSNMKNKINSLKKDNLWICDENDLMVSDNYIFSKFNTYVYKYPYFTFPNNNDSTFHEDHLNYHKIYKISNYITNENMYKEYITINL